MHAIALEASTSSCHARAWPNRNGVAAGGGIPSMSSCEGLVSGRLKVRFRAFDRKARDLSAETIENEVLDPLADLLDRAAGVDDDAAVGSRAAMSRKA